MYRGKKFIAATMAAMLMVTAVGNYVYSNNIVFAAMSRAEADCKAKVDKITSSLKSNYLGLKNVGQWQQYIKEARALAAKLSRSIRVKYEDQINKAESLVNAAARVNKVEQSMSVNSHTLKNVATWEQYISLAKTDLAKVNRDIFAKQINELNSRIVSREAVIANIKLSSNAEKVKIRSGEYLINCEIVKPKNMTSATKMVVIVGDAGATGMDGGTEVNTPYKDIAQGLASKGIASLRFDKRYFTYGMDFTLREDYDFTLKEDYIDDYKAVMSYISGRSDINKDNIYVIGFGQGGSLIPMLDRACSIAKGYVFMGANQSAPEDIISNMSKAMVDVIPNITQGEKNQMLSIINAEVNAIKGLTTYSPDDFYLDQSTKYWLSYRGYDPASRARDINKPMMFLHGSNDFAVPVSEIELFRGVLSSKENMSFKVYSGLTSEFIAGPKNFDAYTTKGKVSQTVIDDISGFINN